MIPIGSEADKLLKALFDYARRRREEGVYDLTQIMYEYSKYVLPEFLETSRNVLGKKFNLYTSSKEFTIPKAK